MPTRTLITAALATLALGTAGCGQGAKQQACIITEAGNKLCGTDAETYCQQSSYAVDAATTGCISIMIAHDRKTGDRPDAAIMEAEQRSGGLSH
jgi:hypothetical protein